MLRWQKAENNSILAGWGGTAVDSLSTMILMGLQDSPQYQRAVEHSRRIDFTRTHEGADQEGEPRVGVVSIFETTIRYIGGLLSAYQLGGERAQDRFMVQQMQTLADGLSFGWDKGHRIPFNYVQINTTPPRPDDSSDTANLAEAGSLLLEWHSLSQYSQNSTYGALAMQSMRAIMESKGAFPGLFPQNIWPGNESYKDDYHTYGGGTDSFYVGSCVSYGCRQLTD